MSVKMIKFARRQFMVCTIFVISTSGSEDIVPEG